MAQVLMRDDILGPTYSPDSDVILAVSEMNVTYRGALGSSMR